MTARPARAAALLLVVCGWLAPGLAAGQNAAAGVPAGGGGGAPGPGRTQAQGAAEVAHVGIVVRDAAASAAAYAALAGVAAPAVEAAGGDEPARVARLRLANVAVDLIEPTGPPGGAWRDFLDTRGQGVHHLALRTGGAAERIDLSARLGLLVEIVPPAAADRPHGRTAAESAGGDPAADLDRPACITHLGVAVRDIRAARQALLDVVGVEPTPIRVFQAARGLGEFTAFNLRNISIELLQQVGDGAGTYADFLDLHGQRVHHIGLHFRNAGDSLDMPAQAERLERHGGALAADGGSHAYFDLRSRLGLLVEALSPAASDTIYPHPHDAP